MGFEFSWCNQQGSNLRPPPSQGGALIQLSYGCTILASKGNIAKRKKKASNSREKEIIAFQISLLLGSNTKHDRLWDIGDDIFTVGHEIFPEKERLIFPRDFWDEDLDMHISIFLIIMMKSEYCRQNLLWADRCISYTDFDIVVPDIESIKSEVFWYLFRQYYLEFEECLFEFFFEISEKFHTSTWSWMYHRSTTKSIEWHKNRLKEVGSIERIGEKPKKKPSFRVVSLDLW